jgi:hypothetical protein
MSHWGGARIWSTAGLLVGLVAIVSSLLAAAVVTGFFQPPARLPQAVRPAPYVTMTVEPGRRKVYPYSIVPGGAESLDEAKQAMADPGTRAGCQGIDLAKLRQVKLRKNLSGYISYREGNQIYWTSKMVTLGAGETVFTDGVYLLRGRGLNCYASHPMLPTRPDEPSEQALDKPMELPVVVFTPGPPSR